MKYEVIGTVYETWEEAIEAESAEEAENLAVRKIQHEYTMFHVK